MQITPPFGYSDIAPLEKHHRVLLPGGEGSAVPGFAARVNAMAISFSEFAVAQRDYPIVFSSADGGASFAPVVVLGLADAQNLFVDQAGRWAEGAYVPAFVRRFPFCISRIFVDGVVQDERLVCVEKSYIDEGGIALFDAAGGPTPPWIERERLLAEYEKDLDTTAQMCTAFSKLDLFVPFTMQVKHGEAAGLKMNGMYCIDESRFVAQKAASHKALATRGLAARVYAHLFSLGNFSRLVDRALARAASDRQAARGG
jgi:SapC